MAEVCALQVLFFSELTEDKSPFSRVLVSHSRAGSYYVSQVHELGPHRTLC